VAGDYDGATACQRLLFLALDRIDEHP
jgi:hypothetical protein